MEHHAGVVICLLRQPEVDAHAVRTAIVLQDGQHLPQMRNRAQAFWRLCQLLRFIEHRRVAEKLRQTHQAARHVRLNGQAVEVELHIQRVFVRHHVAHRRALLCRQPGFLQETADELHLSQLD